MYIAENILKHNLKNVFFLTGTALAGKTTMTRELCDKHGFIPYYEDWNGNSFIEYKSIINEKYQPGSSKHETTDWEAYFGRTVEEFLSDKAEIKRDEYFEFAVIDLTRLSVEMPTKPQIVTFKILIGHYNLSRMKYPYKYEPVNRK